MRLSLLVLFGLFLVIASASAQELDCNPGDFYDTTTGVCEACPQDTYTNQFNMTACIPCPAGQTSPTESDHCTPTSSQTYVESPNTGVAGIYIPPPTSTALCAAYIQPGQSCTPGDLGTAQSICAADANCGGVICHVDGTSCSLRYLVLTAPYSSPFFNFFLKNAPAGYWFEEHDQTELPGITTVPSGVSRDLCVLYLVKATAQCVPPTVEAAQSMCAFDPQCGGINCQTLSGICSLRYFALTPLLPDKSSTAYLKK